MKRLQNRIKKKNREETQSMALPVTAMFSFQNLF